MIITTSPGCNLPPMSRRAIAETLGTSDSTVGKLRATDLLPNYLPESVARLAQLPILTTLEHEDGTKIPVLRLGAPEDVDESDRSRKGYRVDYSADEVHASANRWWPPQGRDSILRAGAYLVVAATVAVAWLDVHDVREVSSTTGRVWYDSTLVALRNEDGTVTALAPESSNAGAALATVGARAQGGSGGNFTTL